MTSTVQIADVDGTTVTVQVEPISEIQYMKLLAKAPSGVTNTTQLAKADLDLNREVAARGTPLNESELDKLPAEQIIRISNKVLTETQHTMESDTDCRLPEGEWVVIA